MVGTAPNDGTSRQGNDAAKIFAKNVTRLRKKSGLSQYDLAAKTDISRCTIGHYENEGMLPPADRLQVLAAALEVPVSKLFEENAVKTNSAADLSDINPRSVKKLRDILSLPAEDRNDLYRILNKMLRKNQLEKQSLASNR
jgi:transcriptional regulator with XRE-family HTH domain